MEIKVYRYPLPKQLEEEVEQILEENFGVASGATPEEYEGSLNTHYDTPVEYIMALDGEKLVGLQNIFLREVEFKGQRITVGGLGGLCVNREYRGRGIAHQLLAKAKEELKKLNCDIGMLFTDVDNPRFTSLYAKFDYVNLAREYTYVDKLGKMKRDRYAMISPINSPERYHLVLDSPETLHIGAGEF